MRFDMTSVKPNYTRSERKCFDANSKGQKLSLETSVNDIETSHTSFVAVFNESKKEAIVPNAD